MLRSWSPALRAAACAAVKVVPSCESYSPFRESQTWGSHVVLVGTEGAPGQGGSGEPAAQSRLHPQGRLRLRRGFPREAERGGAAGGGRASAGVTAEEEKWAEKSEWTRGGRESGSGWWRRQAGAVPLPRGTPPARHPGPRPRGQASDPTLSPDSNLRPAPHVPVRIPPAFWVPSRFVCPHLSSFFLPGVLFTFSMFLYTSPLCSSPSACFLSVSPTF